MGLGASFLFDVVAVVFLVLTLLVASVVVGVATDMMDAPVLAPDEDDPLPTQYVPVTLTPSPVPGMEQTPVETPAPDAD